MLDQIRIVLSHTTHPGNIGAAARAMKVMGLSQLALVNPRNYPSAEATERASRATDILASARLVSETAQAVSDCQLVVGASARGRTLSNRIVTPRELVERIKAEPARRPVAIVFGTENSGLTNEELQLCHYQLFIPTNPEYSSLNLASAVQLVAYECRLGLSDEPARPKIKNNKPDPALTQEETEGVIQHFREVMRRTGYLRDEYARQIDQRIHRLFNKADLTQSEMNILRGFFSSVEKYVAKIDQSEKDA